MIDWFAVVIIATAIITLAIIANNAQQKYEALRDQKGTAMKEYKTTSYTTCVTGDAAPQPQVPTGDGWELWKSETVMLGAEMVQYQWIWIRKKPEAQGNSGEDQVLTQ